MIERLIQLALIDLMRQKAGMPAVGLAMPREYLDLNSEQWLKTLQAIVLEIRHQTGAPKHSLPLLQTILESLRVLMDSADLAEAKKHQVIAKLAPVEFDQLSWQELEQAIMELQQRIGDSNLILIKTVAALSFEEKQNFRQFFTAAYHNANVQFLTDQNLLGGISIAVNGTVVDYSWHKRISNILK